MTETQMAALDKLAQYLAIRDHSELELKQKLSKRFEKDTIDWALSEALERGWIKTPEELAEQVAQELHRKKKGHLYISNYLRKKGLPAVAMDNELELGKCHEWFGRKWDATEPMDQKQKAKIVRQLRSRGFCESTILEVLNS